MFLSIPLLVAASLPAASILSWSVDSRLSVAAEPAKAWCRFVQYPETAGQDVFKENPDFWLKGVDFSCVSPWNGETGRLRAGTAISLRHIIYANHYPIPHGARMIFVGADGGACPCRLIDSRQVAQSDLRVGLLDYELTPNIHPARILSDDCCLHIGNGEGLPVVTFNQHEEAVVSDWRGCGTNAAERTFSCCQTPVVPKRRAFRKNIIVGDSGDPAFLIYRNEPILLHTLSGGGDGSGPFVTGLRKRIQTTMNELCPNYKLNCFDFSAVRSPAGTDPCGIANFGVSPRHPDSDT